MSTPLDTLKTELAKPAYSGKAAAEVLVMLNTPAAGRRPAPIAEVVLTVFQGPYYAAITAAAESAADAGVKAAAKATVGYLSNPHVAHLDFDLAAVQQVLAALVAGSVIPQSFADSLSALGNASASWAELNGFPCGVTSVNVRRAMKELNR
jgi:hypothetical protein